jgi:hypothetical protein
MTTRLVAGIGNSPQSMPRSWPHVRDGLPTLTIPPNGQNLWVIGLDPKTSKEFGLETFAPEDFMQTMGFPCRDMLGRALRPIRGDFGTQCHGLSRRQQHRDS